MAADDPDRTVVNTHAPLGSPGAPAAHAEAETVLLSVPGTDPPHPAAVQQALVKERYKIVRELGRGGFGVVYLAHDEQLHSRPVVIKVLLERPEGIDQWLTRKFHEETEALARLDHPGIVNVLDAGQLPDGKPFLVMQFVAGITLRAAIDDLDRKGQRMELDRASRIVQNVAHALTAAHERGVFHRDLKPENIMLYTPGGAEEAVKIIDFGIATVREAQADTAPEITRAAGSMPYMAPEQLVGRPAAASDVFALGVVAFELVAGMRPFTASTMAAMYLAVQSGLQQDVAELRPGLPAGMQSTLEKALAFAPEERYTSAAEFGDEFARVLSAPAVTPPLPAPLPALPPVPQASTTPVAPATVAPPPIASRAAPHRASFKGRWVALAAVALAICGAAGLMYYRAVAPEHSFSYSITVQRFRDQKPVGDPFVLPGEMIFESGHQIRFNVASRQSGYLYILNEGPAEAGQQTSFNMLYPSQGQSAALGAGENRQIPARGWIVFDQQEGVERLWMVWAARPLPEFEAAKEFAQSQDQGAVKDPARVAAIQRVLSSTSGGATVVERDDADHRTVVHGRSEVLVKLTKLEHH